VVRPPGSRPGVVVSQIHYHCIEPSAVAALGGDIVLSNDHTTVQAFTVGPTITGLQFHPELDPAATRATVTAHDDLIRAHGTTPDAVLASVDHLATRWRPDTFDRFVTRPAAAAAHLTPRTLQLV
jgi:GMP synthase-like glutamine amidotransferase